MNHCVYEDPYKYLFCCREIRQTQDECELQPAPVKWEREDKIKWAQQQANFQADKLQLNLQDNDQQVLECRGRIMGEYPIYLPDNHPFTAKLVFNAHLSTLHGGVGLTMAKVREKYWVPRL